MTTRPRPKTHAETRRSHLALQARRDALVQMRAGETVDIRLARDAGGDLVRARALRDGEDPDGLLVLAIYDKRLRADWCSGKDGLRVGPRHLNTKAILGVVLAKNGESPYQGDDWYMTMLRTRVEAAGAT